ncbi:ThiF family adenylyltransferase [Arthrobacter sp. YA7-1]|uniref:ThiF family adenylyltransferase n=1 Tax=Arthrobacter sp. YA7-1 TaxID=2987701 RepID=UPI00222605E4|nr:ThiF family adenylyltransferase [Arthrobacter sp. YA7-1]UYY83058.1 ThiF family adenylyltransferase [Arthrobacter sp. YA7-1]
MSQRLISRNAPLKRLRDEGYEVSVEGGYLVVRHIPYVTQGRTLSYGVMVSALEVSGDTVREPSDHTVRFAGEVPCTGDGSPFNQIINGYVQETVSQDLVAEYSFSSKPASGRYEDYYEKMTTYIRILEGEAHTIDPTATARTHPVISPEEELGSVFRYMDTASSRAGITAITDKLAGHRIGIVGLGGTGSYILDLVAKTPVAEIHLYDRDQLLQHNAFRMPGALSVEELAGSPGKVVHLAASYSKLRSGVVAHECHISDENVGELAKLDFVFLSLTGGEAKRGIVTVLEENHVPFIDCGMGIYEVDGVLAGQLRTTTSTPGFREHVHGLGRIPFSDGEADEYSQNIQIADLNALNASIAVIRWKKFCGFYLDLEGDHHSVYVIDGNHMLNEDKA